MIKKRGVMTWPEKRVAKALHEAGFKWRYEWEAVLNHGNGYEGVRYPDFYLPETDVYIEVLCLNPTDESIETLQKKLKFYENNNLDYFTLDPRKPNKELKSISELKEEIEEHVYTDVREKELPYYSEKRFIDDFLVSRDGYRQRMYHAVI